MRTAIARRLVRPQPLDSRHRQTRPANVEVPWKMPVRNSQSMKTQVDHHIRNGHNAKSTINKLGKTYQ